jgi:hypothetical protein
MSLKALSQGLIFLEGLVSENWASQRNGRKDETQRELQRIGKKDEAQKKLEAMSLVVRGWKFLAGHQRDNFEALNAAIYDTINQLLPFRKQTRGARENVKRPHTIPIDQAVRQEIDHGSSFGKALAKLPGSKRGAAKTREQRRRRKEKNLIKLQG